MLKHNCIVFVAFLYTVILMDIVIPHKLFTIPRKKRKGKIIESIIQ